MCLPPGLVALSDEAETGGGRPGPVGTSGGPLEVKDVQGLTTLAVALLAL